MVSDCCGADVKLIPQYNLNVFPNKKLGEIPVCTECVKPCQPKERADE